MPGVESLLDEQKLPPARPSTTGLTNVGLVVDTCPTDPGVGPAGDHPHPTSHVISHSINNNNHNINHQQTSSLAHNYHCRPNSSSSSITR